MFNNLELLKIGKPGLRYKSQDVDVVLLREGVYDIIINIMAKIADENNFIEVTAPQIGIAKRIIALKLDIYNEDSNQDIEENGVIFMFNPKIKHIDGVSSSEMYEVCSSCSKYDYLVKRPDRIFVDFYNYNGIKKQLFINGYPSHMIQHAVEHLDGVGIL